MPSFLKILSGRLNGVEYTLGDGETVFHVGPQQALLNGTAAQLLERAENAYYLPADLEQADFIVQLAGTDAASPTLRIGERKNANAAWEWRTLSEQTPVAVAGLHVAVRRDTAAWSPAVLDFVPPALPAAVEEPEDAPLYRPRPRGRIALLAGVAILMGVAVTAGWFYWQYLPEARVRGLASVLVDSPADFDIVAGERSRLYVLADTTADRAWAERASRRLQRRDDIHLVRHQEVARIEAALLRGGVRLVVLRLDQPARPEMVLSGTPTAAEQAHARAALAEQIAWKHTPLLSTVSDQQLVALAQRQLQVRGISSRVDPAGRRASVVNDVFLDDAALHDMTEVAAEFHHRWGTHRLTIQPQIWDDLLQGRSYRYSPGQLLSIGSGRWNYAGAAGTAMH